MAGSTRLDESTECSVHSRSLSYYTASGLRAFRPACPDQEARQRREMWAPVFGSFFADARWKSSETSRLAKWIQMCWPVNINHKDNNGNDDKPRVFRGFSCDLHLF